MAKKKALKKTKSANSRIPRLKSKKVQKPLNESINRESLKEGILSVNNQEADYDKVFEDKLAESYKMFRELKEHRLQIKKLGGIMVFILVIVLAALLLLTFS